MTSSKLGLCAVTGGNGFLGTNIVNQLQQKGYAIRVLDIHNSLNKEISIANTDNNIQYSKCDITNAKEVNQSLKDVTTIFHCAAIIDIRYSPSPNLYNVNVDGTQNLLDFCNNHKNENNKVKYLVYTSSMEVLNMLSCQKDLINVKESEINPYLSAHWHRYGATKTMAEQMITENGTMNKRLKTCAIRVNALYGPGLEVLRLVAQYPIAFGNDKCVMSMCYVENAAFAHVQLAEALVNDGSSSVNGHVFHYKDFDHCFHTFVMTNILGIAEKNIYQLPKSIAYVMSYTVSFVQFVCHKVLNKLICDPMAGLSISAVNLVWKNVTMNTEKFHKVIGYNPPFTNEESIQKTKDWVGAVVKGRKTATLNIWDCLRTCIFAVIIIAILIYI